jgi:hypothetical protein
MMRAFIALTILIAAFCLRSPSSAQVGFDRRGNDYTSFAVRSGDPAVCAARCDRESRCRAWSFAYPTAERPATCWLKEPGAARVEAFGDSAPGVRRRRGDQPRAQTVVLDRSPGRRLPHPRSTRRIQRRGLPARLRGRQPMPRLDLYAARLRRIRRAVLPQEPPDAAPPPALLHFRGGEIADDAQIRRLRAAAAAVMPHALLRRLL